MKRMTIRTSLVALICMMAAMPAGASVLETLNDAGIHFNGFVEYDIGARTQDDPVEDDLSLHEIRLQLDGQWYHDLFTAQVKFDFVDDDLAMDQEDVDLETGYGFFDLRQANVLMSPLAWVDLKVGRQVLTWGTGDLVFINDLFPKDWQSFFLGRDVEYLKAPSDALFVSLFPPFANIDIAYTPRFDADRHITGERISYWNGQGIVGQDSVLNTDRPDDWFEDDELAARIYRSFGAYEWAAYGYYGFWKSPGGMNPGTGEWIFPALAVYGGSVRGPVGKGIMNVEAGYYDSLDDRDGDDPFVNNSEARALVGYEQELMKNFMVGVQYYFERMFDYCEYMDALEAMGQPTDTARDEDRHTLTLRLTSLLMNQNLVLSCFTRYSPSDHDVYIKPVATYKVSDRWKTSVGGNIFFGEDDHTFLGQFEANNNVSASVRFSF
ncbi:hypothetical protein ACFL4G_06480 [Thermodesulfobacteriota bacterium]